MENQNKRDEEQNGVEDMQAWGAGIAQMLQSELPPVRYPEIEVQECQIALPDGAKLHAKVHKPKAEGKWPVILVRNPYMGNELIFDSITGPAFARYGYALVDVNVRGAVKSEGDWLPFEHEREDGRVVIDWIAEQEWCDGNIGTFGGSYLGHTQWSIADYHHPYLKTMFISVYGVRPYHTFYRRGMFRQEVWTAWASQMIEDNRYQFFLPQDSLELAKKAYAIKPQSRLGEELKGKHCGWYQNWITSTREDDSYWSEGFWKKLQEAAGKVTIPIHLHGGWFDIFLRPQIDSYRMLPKEVREKSRFLIGPWCHSGMPGGDLQYPGENCAGLFQLKAALEWFDYQLKGMEYSHELGVIEAYSIGDNKWKCWKDDFAREAEIVLHFGKNEMEQAGERLTENCPKEEQKITYRYDPGNPVESIGGTLLANNRDPKGQPECSTQQPPIGYRKDVISFVSEPFVQSISMSGAIEVHLFVASSAPATAFCVKVMEVFDDGRSMNIRDDITDIRWVDEKKTEAYEPGTVRELTLTMLDCSWAIRAGSRVRVDIASSNFPAYHVHPNVASCWAETTEKQVAEQTVYCGGRYPSRILLPIAEAENGN